jgi:hypothetical protein
MEQMTKEQGQPRKIYSMRSIWAGTFLGGPLTAGYLIAENFKTLGQIEKVKPTWIIAIIATIIIFGGIFMVPNTDKIPRQIIPLIYTAIAYYIVNEIQGDKIKAYISETGKAFSVWRSLGVGLIWAIITVIPIFIYVLLTDPTLTATNKSYGQLKHEIYFNKTTVTENEADKIADALTQTIFFDNEQQKVVLLEKNNSKYIISIPIIKDAWDEADVVNYFKSLRVDVQTFFRDNKVVINLCSDEDITQIKKVLD